MLNQARGEKAEVVLQPGGHSGMLTGVIMGVEHKKEVNGKDTVEGEFLNLWCAEGLRSVKLSDVQNVRFLNPVLDGEVKKALEALALAHDTQKKAVCLNFMGEGKRPVKVGYVVENPIWKTSYRLVLDKKGKPYLQGWAIVENTQDEDWNNVRVALISGRPISFQMDLYEPLTVARPVVEPELFASLRPPTYSGALTRERKAGNGVTGFGGTAGINQVENTPVAVPATCTAPMAVPPAVPQTLPNTPAPSGGQRAAEIDPRRGAPSAAVATELGDFFQYQIEHPVSLPRQKSALLPIVTEEIQGDKLSIYNETTHAKFPLLGLRFRNTTKLHLMQGPITVYDNSSYAGDARILDLQPNEERLLSYAIDLGVEVEPVVHEAKERIIQIKIVKGVLQSTVKTRASKTYTIKNRTEHERTVLIEHPYRSEFTLVKPEKAEERARDVYRFEVLVAAGKTARRDVVEEKEEQGNRPLADIDEESVRFVASQRVTSEKVKEALAQTMALKGKLLATRQENARKNQRLAEIGNDQARLRANLKEVPPSSEAYKRYVKKFDAQESEIALAVGLAPRLSPCATTRPRCGWPVG